MPPPPPASHAHDPPQQPPSGEEVEPLVLVVEDDALVRQAVGDALRSAGYNVILTADTTSAFTVLIEPGMHVDCVVADLRLDRRSGTRDGIFFLDYVATMHPWCGRVIHTGHADDLEPEAFTAHTVIEKPVLPYVLIKAIADEIERRSSAAPSP
jgi:DNA-binding NtrC family response regulator